MLVVLPDPFREMGQLHGVLTVWLRSRSGPEAKNEEVVPKMARRRGSDAGQSRRTVHKYVRIARVI